MFGHLVQLQRRLGKEAFPLIDQTFYPDHREMVSTPFWAMSTSCVHIDAAIAVLVKLWDVPLR